MCDKYNIDFNKIIFNPEFLREGSAFYDFFTAEEGRPGAIVTLIAVLELLKESMIEIVEAEKDGLIYIKVVV